MESAVARELYTCPKCGTQGTKQLLTEAGYHCPRCTFEVAHLEIAPNGTVRNVMGWLRPAGELLQERYRVVGILGKGGFAATYLVEDLRLRGKRRALKEIPQGLYDEYETELLSRLQHPGIPDIVDRFEADGMVYLVLEFGGDRSLESERRASSGRIALERLLPWMRQLCEVLAYLHGQSPPVVHRDLKPENILLDEHDRVMLIDFGIAKESAEWGATRTIARSASHGFSPPEQVLGTGTDQRSDVYALGGTVYALLTGTVPPPAHERVAGQELPAPRSLNPAIPPALEAAIVQALDLNINRRQQSIAELSLAFALEASPPGPAAGELGVRTQRVGEPSLVGAASSMSARAGEQIATAGPRSARPKITLTLVGLGVVAAAAVLWFSIGSTPPEKRAAEPAGRTPESAAPAAAPAPPTPRVATPAPPAPAAGGESATAIIDQLRERRAEHEVEPRRPPEPARPSVQPRRAPPPAPPAASDGWTIQPHGATRTD